MRIGKLDQRVTIQSPTYAGDGLGDSRITGWSTVYARWAKVEAKSGSEGEEARKKVPRQSYTVTLRYDAAITPTMSLLWGSVRLQIVAVANTSARDDITVLECVETK